ncbi:GyrI-like domain-containing protein [Paenibacillus sp. sptzw28]|uniref:GyrI-like domain-containing protein n=1 Tax=Paenibacillus sp. sptzw28 TaxID=715179 RepID=UPI001C6E7847|nr:GyrI-like domain-containing protein [Paenibacillus sp. sptzw28]QYR23495.1 GyrI-like domain-containing protein [Paenibacillus sp. sptzw28]
MNVAIIEKPEVKAIVLKSNQNGRDVRQAWKQIQELLIGYPTRYNKEYGYVFIPEWQWSTGVHTLWVGVEVDSFEYVPIEVERFIIPSRKYAKLTVNGGREEMNSAYNYLNEWFKDNGCERDVAEGSFSLEVNRLKPTNPFLIPADEIDRFDFDVYAPIKIS